MTSIEELRRLAEAATQSPCRVEHGETYPDGVPIEAVTAHDSLGFQVIAIRPSRKADAAYIAAADPTTILWLLKENQFMAAMLDTLNHSRLTASLKAAIDEACADAWDEGHRTPKSQEPDGCECSAWNASECACGRYGTGLTPNPYRQEDA